MKVIHLCFILVPIALQSKAFFRDIQFDLSYGPGDADRIFFKTKLAPNKLEANLKMLGQEGNLVGEYQALPGDYFLKLDIQSSIEAVKKVNLNMEHKLKEEGKMTIASKVRNTYILLTLRKYALSNLIIHIYLGTYLHRE